MLTDEREKELSSLRLSPPFLLQSCHKLPVVHTPTNVPRHGSKCARPAWGMLVCFISGNGWRMGGALSGKQPLLHGALSIQYSDYFCCETPTDFAVGSGTVLVSCLLQTSLRPRPRNDPHSSSGWLHLLFLAGCLPSQQCLSW